MIKIANRKLLGSCRLLSIQTAINLSSAIVPFFTEAECFQHSSLLLQKTVSQYTISYCLLNFWNFLLYCIEDQRLICLGFFFFSSVILVMMGICISQIKLSIWNCWIRPQVCSVEMSFSFAHKEMQCVITVRVSFFLLTLCNTEYNNVW